jgi:hypothetical protein
MSGKAVETILTAWRKLERDLATANGDARVEIQARIAELQAQYQAVFTATRSRERVDGGLTVGLTVER